MHQSLDIRVAPNGRLVLPRIIRDALGLEGAGTLVAIVEDGEVRLVPIAKSVARAQALYRKHVKDDRDTGSFLAERRAEAAREI